MDIFVIYKIKRNVVNRAPVFELTFKCLEVVEAAEAPSNVKPRTRNVIKLFMSVIYGFS
jgi:hypothetical protein